jgi:hypothetical protein
MLGTVEGGGEGFDGAGEKIRREKAISEFPATV